MHSAATSRFVVAVLMFGMGCLAPAAGARAQAFGLARIQAQDGRLATVALRLGMAAAPACSSVARRPGWTLHNLSQYGPRDRPALTEALGMDATAPSLFALADGGPAAAAGLEPDDVVLSVNGAPLAEPASPAASFEPLRSQMDRLDTAFAAGPAVLRLRRSGQEREVTVAGEAVCGARTQLSLAPGLVAEADDRTVSVSLGLAEFAANDGELAFVVGHELAHVIHGDRARRLAAGERWTEADQVAAERAADVTGMELAAQAGYAPTAAATFWRRLAAAHPELNRPGGGHPSASDRALTATAPPRP